jgi:hypothetical protein
MGVVDSARASDEYRVREARSGDRAAFLSLYGAVWGHERDPDWYDWRFDAVPWSDGARIALAERDGSVVGAAACLPYRLRIGDRTHLAYQPVDWIVHPEHRGQGLCRRMIAHRIERDADATCYFNFPTPPLRPLLADMGWRSVCRPRTYYRIAEPAAALGAVDAPALLQRVASAAKPLLSAYAGVRRGRWQRRGADVVVDRTDGIAADPLAGLYRERVPGAIHVPRTETYYGWRFENPRWDCRTYVARRDGDPVAALVTCAESADGQTVVRLAERLPLGPQADDTAVAALLAAAVGDNADAALVKTTAETIPGRVLNRFGFLADDRPLIDRFTTQTAQFVRPLGADGDGGDWTRGDATLDDPDDWLVPLGTQDIA